MVQFPWEAESNPSALDHLKLDSDPVTLEHTNNRDVVSQQNDDGNFTRKNNIASDSIAEAPRSDIHSNHDYVNTPRIDTRITIDATFWKTRYIKCASQSKCST